VTKSRRFYRDLNGILLLDKALGLSSNAALQEARAVFGARKAGHAGSLDPLASGVLPVCFGQATKVCGRLLNSGKTYRVQVRLGARTASGDLETPVIERAEVPALSAEYVDTVLGSFEGEQSQVPPMHSALKFAGKRLYELARRGESVDRPARRIVLRTLQRIHFAEDVLTFAVHCSKGTYIRTLAADLAQRLGTVGYVEGLRRLSVDPFGSFPAYTLAELASLSQEERDAKLLGADAAFADLPRIDLDERNESGLLLGQTVDPRAPTLPGEARAYGAHGDFLGLVEAQSTGRIKPLRLFMPAGMSAEAQPETGPDAGL
jgi:tRNA pseudouridine55 synthase